MTISGKPWATMCYYTCWAEVKLVGTFRRKIFLFKSPFYAAFCRIYSVQLAINQSTQERVAVKILSKENISPSTIQKEIILHKQITKAYQQQFGSLKKSHVHLVQLLDFFQDSSHYYCILEWAGGGELFDLIEPDLGLEEDLAHFYFWQCLNSLSFLHDLGIAHRDMKPENLLLDTAGNLYISDFGLSTLFQHQGTVRFLTTPCGSPVYVAPEVLTGSYHGPAVDVWSCGIILFAMLVGSKFQLEACIKFSSCPACRYTVGKAVVG